MGMPSKRPFGDLQEDEGLRLKKKTLLSSTPCGNSGQEEQIDEQDRTDVIFKPCKPPCQPLGNLLLAQNGRAGNARDRGLGSLAVLPDELLVGIFSDLEAMDLVRMQAVSHAMYAFTRVEGKWKHEFILKNSGVLDRWRGSWRQTYLHRFCPRLVSLDRLPTDALEICDVYSDVLSAPYLAARYDPGKLVRSSKFADNIPRIDGSKLKAGDLGSEPMILSRLMDDWPAFMGGSQAAWSLETIANRYPNVPFRAEAVLTQLSDYIAYHNHCQHDESPLYIFDADFVEKTEAYEPGHGLLHDFNVPKIFQDDLFSVLGKQRPNYRWLIAGPARSGSTFHCDPNATSAWNAVVTGKKLWILFPPHITPPGVIVSNDQAEVEAPLSLAEWFSNFYHQAKRQYGPAATDPRYINTMLEGVCNPGETFYVPSGWWHLVVNLEDSIAITQNFVSRSNLHQVLHFLRNRPEQVSGFAVNEEHGQVDDESGGGCVSAIFESALQATHPGIYAAASKHIIDDVRAASIKQVKSGTPDKPANLWQQLRDTSASANGNEVGFSFDFGLV